MHQSEPRPSGSGCLLGARAASVRKRDGAIVCGIGPAVVGNDGGPAGTAGILIVWVAAQALVELAVLAEFLAIEFDAEAGLIGHADGAVFVTHEAALNDVAGEVRVVGIGAEGTVGADSAQRQQGRAL